MDMDSNNMWGYITCDDPWVGRLYQLVWMLTTCKGMWWYVSSILWTLCFILEKLCKYMQIFCKKPIMLSGEWYLLCYLSVGVLVEAGCSWCTCNIHGQYPSAILFLKHMNNMWLIEWHELKNKRRHTWNDFQGVWQVQKWVLVITRTESSIMKMMSY